MRAISGKWKTKREKVKNQSQTKKKKTHSNQIESNRREKDGPKKGNRQQVANAGNAVRRVFIALFLPTPASAGVPDV